METLKFFTEICRKEKADVLAEEHRTPIVVRPDVKTEIMNIRKLVDVAAIIKESQEKCAAVIEDNSPGQLFIASQGTDYVEKEDNFKVDKNCIIFKGELVANFTVGITKYQWLMKNDEELIKKLFTLRISTEMGVAECEEVDMTQFRNPSFYRSIPDFPNLVVFKSTLFVEYLDLLMAQCQLHAEKVFIHSGWHKVNGRMYYIDRLGAVGFLDVKAVAKTELCLGNKGAVNISDLDYLLNVAGDKSLMIMAFSVMSTAFTLFKEAGFPPKFLMFLNGKTNSGKTSLALALTKLLGRTTGTQIPKYTFQGTSAGIERGISEHHGMVFLVDDLHPTEDTNKRRRLEANLEHLVKLFGDGIEKNRNTDFMNQEKAAQIDYHVNGGCLITGEYFTGVTSSLARMLVLDINREDINFNVLQYLQDNPIILEKFYFSLITYITVNYAQILEMIRLEVPKLRAMNIYALPRYNEYHALFSVAGKVLSGFLISIGYQNVSHISMQLKGAFNKCIAHNDMLVRISSRTFQIKSAISEFYKSYVEGAAHGIDIFETDEWFGLSPVDALVIVNSFLENMGGIFKFSSKSSFIKACSEEKLIHITKEANPDGTVHTRNVHKIKKKNNKGFLLFIRTELGIRKGNKDVIANE